MFLLLSKSSVRRADSPHADGVSLSSSLLGGEFSYHISHTKFGNPSVHRTSQQNIHQDWLWGLNDSNHFGSFPPFLPSFLLFHSCFLLVLSSLEKWFFILWLSYRTNTIVLEMYCSLQNIKKNTDKQTQKIKIKTYRLLPPKIISTFWWKFFQITHTPVSLSFCLQSKQSILFPWIWSNSE